jgi:hypothetical protein
MSAILDIECPLTRGERTLSAPIRNQSVVSTHVLSHSGEFSPRLGDVALVSRGVSFEFARKDRRGLTGENGSMGGGWTYTYDKRFELDGDHVVYCDGLGGPVASRRGVATDGSLPTASTHCSSAGTSTQRCVSGTATCSTCELGSLRDAAVRRRFLAVVANHGVGCATSKSARTSCGVRSPRTRRGRSLSSAATRSRSARVCTARLVRFGKY